MTRIPAISLPTNASPSMNGHMGEQRGDDYQIKESDVALAPAAAETEDMEGVREDAVRSHLRGSGVLFVGRMMSKWLNFGVQVLVVRILSQADYGALAYALSVVTMLQQLATLGLHQSITRFVPIYQEQKRYRSLLGTIVMSLGSVVVVGFVLVAAIHLGQGMLGRFVISDPSTLTLLVLLAYLVPVQALDNVLVGLFAVFAHPGAIFFRRHVLAPGLKLVVLLLVMLGGQGLFTVAAGYLVAELVGVAIGAALLWRFMREQGIFRHFDRRTIHMPWREVFAFTIPLLSSDLLIVILPTIEVVLLGKFSDVDAVAAYRAVVPLALMIDMVKASFSSLFMPAAARMLARHDREGINNLYWQSAIWTSVLSFPVFVITFATAEPVTVLLFGDAYRGSAVLLSILSLAMYFEVLMGFNSLVVKVYGRLRYSLLANAATLVVSVAAGLALIPPYGALGAAIATALTWSSNTLFNQFGLRLGTGIRMFEPRYLAAYLVMILAAIAVWAVQHLASPPLYISFAMAAAASLFVLRWNGRLLRAAEVFPELGRIPLLKRLMGQ